MNEIPIWEDKEGKINRLIDLVFPLGTGSTHANIEIKYSLRSVEKHLSNVGKVFIIGVDIPFLKDIHHLSFKETANNHNENIRQKVLAACYHPEISEDFLFMNDDHFLLQDFDLPNFPNYYKGTLEDYKFKNNGWYLADLLWTQGKIGNNALNFDTHTPIIYNKTRFKERLGNVEPVGILIKSMYAHGLEGTKEPDAKLYRRHTMREIEYKTQSAPCFSICDRAINEDLMKFLNYLYPKKSRWEI